MLASTASIKAADVFAVAESTTAYEIEAVETTIQKEIKNIKKIVNESEITEPRQLTTTREIVKDYFKDIPIMIDVAYCESGIVQFNSDGSVLRGFVNPADVGVMQINEKYHLETSIRLGLDIHTLQGNLDYGRYLYETQGTRPWEYSSHCWNKSREVALN